MLVIPALDLQAGRCVLFRPEGETQVCGYYEDPLKMAKLWRIQNAKVLHVVDLDALQGDTSSRDEHREILRSICQELDIPIQFRGGIRTIADVAELLDLGIYRVVLASAIVSDPGFLGEAISRFSASRVVAGIDSRNGRVCFERQKSVTGLDPIQAALDYERRGCRRILLTDLDRAGQMSGPNTALCKAIGGRLDAMRITQCGGVSGYGDLMELAELKDYRVDSVVIERALYENAFPCQHAWCWHEKERVDLDQYSTARMRVG